MSDEKNPLAALFDEEPVETNVEETETDVSENAEKNSAAAEKVDGSGTTSKEEGQEGGEEGGEETVPIAAMLGERKKRQKSDETISELRERLAKLEGKLETPQTTEEEFIPPNPKDDPQGYAEYVEARTEERLLNMNLNHSEDLNVVKHGQEKVDAAFEWFKGVANSDRQLYQQVIKLPDPYGEMIKRHDAHARNEKLSGVDDTELEQFRAWKQSQTQAKEGKSGKTKATEPLKSKGEENEAPPSSLADEQSAEGQDPSLGKVGAGMAFDEAF